MDINGGNGYGGNGGGRRAVAGTTDFYRRLPSEMTESTKVGATLSLLSIATMIVLFLCETRAFSRTRIRSNVEIDPNGAALIRLNFNVTLYDVHCDFASVDVWDTLGTNLQNVTKDITKWRLDDAGRKQKFHGHKITQQQEHEETSARDIPDSNGGGPHSTDLTPQNSRAFHAAHRSVMVDFYAPWCIWCQRLAPAWERFAMEVKEKRIDLGVGRVDCVAHQQMCKDERVMAFPTLRWMEDGKAVMPDYRGDRTAEGLVEYAERRVNDGKGGKNDNDKNNRALTINEWDEEHHPGCQVSGYLMVNRVPGNMHVEAKSSHHEINSAMTNLTHRVNHLSFGPPRAPNYNFLALFADALPSTYRHSNPMKGRLYPTEEYHTAFHHHMKIVSSRADYLPSSSQGSPLYVVYQILEESQVVAYEVQEIPEIKFLWDMSPMSVSLEKEGRRWYEYVTNLLAIIGGTYTTLGLINATLLKLFKPKRL